jgi:uncharacterized protein (TIGR02391 family)
MKEVEGFSASAGLPYHGHSGATRPCEEAVLEALQREARIIKARILTCGNHHGLLLVDEYEDLLIVKPGFASGYSGEGPSGFSKSLAMLSAHNAQIDEVDLTPAQYERLELSALTKTDVDAILSMRAVRISQYQDYVRRSDWEDANKGRLWSHYPVRLPLAVIAPGLRDLVIEFDERPAFALQTGYARLEDRLRALTGMNHSGAKLIEAAFSPKSPLLIMKDRRDRGEQAGLEFLFRGALQLHRNPHAHSEIARSLGDAVSEFLLINHLFRILDRVVLAPPEIDETEQYRDV